MIVSATKMQHFFARQRSDNLGQAAVLLYIFIRTMAREFAGNFYKTQQWKKTRELYAKSVGGLCEICWQNGLVVPGVIVHHKIHLTPDNIDDPGITLNWENLQLVCRDCHAKIHKGEDNRRYTIDELGRVVI